MSRTSKRKKRHRRAAFRKQGLPPGSAVYTGDARGTPIVLARIEYNDENLTQETDLEAHLVAPTEEKNTISWLNVDGIHQAEDIAKIGTAYQIHRLWIEDVLNPAGRPKAESLDGRLLVIAKMITYKGAEQNGRLETEQVSFVVGANWVVTFQERTGDVFDPVRRRLSTSTGNIRRRGADYLLHALLDAIVDNYFVAVDVLEARIDELEERAFSMQLEDDAPKDVLLLKQQLSLMRSAVWPMREMIAILVKSEDEVLATDTNLYFRDLYDHIVQTMDVIDSSRERLAGVIDLYLSMNGHQMNKTMRVLTVVATVFIPLTFIAGLYGMNFKNMPELEYRYGYYVVLAAMGVVGGGMLLWFRKRRWM